ncbi:hypothetical protein TNCT_312061 [Trichonephila clavata]|uniref:Uncharacterized protein n=1 Tax=Trichonephila clavata TaxID=2740835 RepID=A0A8X6IBL7_TRICU|nr:hypothetical protein TNCT_312061 [Trichonephila clavata]
MRQVDENIEAWVLHYKKVTFTKITIKIKETPSDTWQTEKITVGSDAEENIDNENYIKNMEENPSLLQKPSFESILEEQMPEE